MSVNRLPALAARLCLSLAAAALLAAPAAAEKLSKESKKWLEEEVAPIVTPSEAKIFKDLKEADRLEFQKIFWSRRDPSNDNVAKPENEFKTEYLQRKLEADQKFRVAGRLGSQTDCGRVYILLGEPDEKKAGPREEAQLGSRNPESWIYNDKPSLSIKGGSMKLEFDSQCRLPEGAQFGEQLTRLAESKVLRPNLEYTFGKDGRLKKLVDMLPKPSPAQTLLKEPRQDFVLSADIDYLKTADGGTALVGVVRGVVEGLATQDVGGKKVAKIVVAAQATNEEGRVAANYEQATLAPVGADGSFSASYRLGLKPGKYDVRVAALEEATKKGSAADKTTEVPDFNTGELTVASLIAVREIEESPAQNDPTHPFNDPAHPFAAFLLGGARLVPYATLTLQRSDTLSIFYQYYDAKLDEATGKASVVASLHIQKADKTVARAPDQPFEAAVGGTVVGPVPLDKYEPGSYLVKLKVTDNKTKKDATRELAFEVK